MIAITGATGQLGRLVIDALLEKLPASAIIAAVRHPDKAADLSARGIEIRHADYDEPTTLATALEGIDKLLLISGSEVGQRVRQHGNAIDAARHAGVELIAYTSILHADRSTVGLAEEHRQTEAALAASGVPHVLLRNGWYMENYTGKVASALEHGVLIGGAGAGRISAATRADLAAAAVAVLTNDDRAGRVYELAGDAAFTMEDVAAEITRHAGRTVEYRNLSAVDHEAALIGAGLPQPIAALLANSDQAVAKDELFDDSRQLSKLIGRPTTTLEDAIRAIVVKTS